MVLYLLSSTKSFQRNNHMTGGYLKIHRPTWERSKWTSLLREPRKCKDCILPFCKHSGSRVVQTSHFMSSVKTGKTANYETSQKTPFLIFSKSWKGGEKKTKLKCLGEAGKGREHVCSILLPNSLNSRQGGRGFSRNKEISGEDQSFCPLRN